MYETIQESVEKLHEVFDDTSIQAEWKKMQEKVEEARYNPGDVRPLADCIFALLLAARSRGYSVEMMMQELHKVADENLHSRWKKMEDGTYHAISG
jgi:hypothetical protein